MLTAAKDRTPRMVDAEAPLREILSHLPDDREGMSGGRRVSSILLLDGRGLLRNGASPNVPAGYLNVIDRLKADPNIGMCVAAAATGEVVVTPSSYDGRRWADLRHLPPAPGFLGA